MRSRRSSRRALAGRPQDIVVVGEIAMAVVMGKPTPPVRGAMVVVVTVVMVQLLEEGVDTLGMELRATAPQDMEAVVATALELMEAMMAVVMEMARAMGVLVGLVTAVEAMELLRLAVDMVAQVLTAVRALVVADMVEHRSEVGVLGVVEVRVMVVVEAPQAMAVVEAVV